MTAGRVLVLVWVISCLAGAAPCHAARESRAAWEVQAERLDREADQALEQGRLAEAEQELRKSLRLRQAALGERHPDVAYSMHRLARLLARRRESTEAEALFRASNDIWSAAGPEYRREFAIGLTRLGALFMDRGRYREAEPYYRHAWEVLSRISDLEPLDRARALNNIGYLEFHLARYGEAEAAFRQALEIKEANGVPGIANDLNNLAEVYRVQARWEMAVPLYLRALELFRAAGRPSEIALALTNLAILDAARAQYPAAEGRFREALTLLKGDEHADPLAVASQEANLGEMLLKLARLPEAEELILSSLDTRRRVMGEDHLEVAASLESLAQLRKMQGRFEEAETLSRRSLEIREHAFPDGHPEVALGLNNLADLLVRQGRYREAEALFRRSQAIYEKAFQPDHPLVATSLDNLAALAKLQGRPQEAERLLDRALAMRRALDDEDGVATILNNLGALYEDQGRFAESLLAYRQALEILERLVGREHPRFAIGLQNIASINASLQRFPQAEALYRQALAVLEKSLGTDHPDVATVVSNLGSIVLSQERLPEAEALFERLLAIRQKRLGSRHPDVAAALDALASVAFVRGQDTQVESLLRRSLALRKEALGPDHPEVSESLNNLGFLMLLLGRDAEAEEFVESAIRILDKVPAYPERQVSLYGLRARLRRIRGDRDGSLQALDQALTMAEQMRPGLGGSEETKAVFLAQYESLFHDMVSWQLEAGRVDRALEYAERRRARVLLDQLTAARVDWRAGIPDRLRTSLLERESQALSQLAEIQQRVRSLAGAVPDELAHALREAESAYAEIYEEMRNASTRSPWQGLARGEPLRLDRIQQEMVRPRELVLLYELGEKESYLFVIPPAGKRLQAFPLKVPAEAAQVLGLNAGSLHGDVLGRLLLGSLDGEDAHDPGVLQALAVPGRDGLTRIFDDEAGGGLSEKLHALWQVLVPKGVRRLLAVSRSVLVVPDGVLHFLPFEALVLESKPAGPVYWLDKGPVVRYGPSLTALRSLDRVSAARSAGVSRPEILSLSDPVFDISEVARRQAAGIGGTAPAGSLVPAESRVETRSAASFFAGTLGNLGGTAWEREAILEVFGKERVRVLQELDATETALRQELSGKRYLHLATHGLVDDVRANLFAALVLTPPLEEAPPSENDGFLQLHEIYDLDLSSCQLAVLSACRTNVGHNVPGEGVFALSRGMMVAGARRVVASQWSVNDASTAELIGELFRQIESMERGGSIDYALALRNARRKVRQAGRWASPRYWAPFVLIGNR